MEAVDFRKGIDGLARYSLALACIEPSKRSQRHFLRQTEVYFILAGRGLMHIAEEAQPVFRGDAIVIPAGSVQWIENIGDDPLEFAAIVSPPRQAQARYPSGLIPKRSNISQSRG